MKWLFLGSITLALAFNVQANSDTPVAYRIAANSADWTCAQATSLHAQVGLTNAGLIDETKVDNDKTEAQLLLKKPFGHGRYEQIFHLTLHQNDGKSMSIISVSTTENSECPSDNIKVYVVPQELGELPSLQWVMPPK